MESNSSAPTLGSLEGRKFALVSHEVEGATGFPMSFSAYLQQEGADIVYIKFPFFYSQTKSIWVEKFEGPLLVSQERSWIRFFQPQLLSFAKDFLWLMLKGWTHIRGSEFVLVSNNLLGFGAWILRTLRIIPQFTYLVVDYSPTRFNNSLIQRLYVFLDRFVATRADSVWTMSMAMLEGRERDGKLKLSEVRYRLAPMGNNADFIFKDGVPANDPRDLVYLGNPNAKNVRADLLLHVAKLLHAKGEKFRLIYVGPGDTSFLKKQAESMGLSDLIVFRGSIAEILDLDFYLSQLGIGLAPYDPTLEDNFSKFADPAKIKTYLGCGLPIVTTSVPVNAKELEARGAGFVADFTAEDFAGKILNLWQDKDLYARTRAAAVEMGMDYTYNKIFNRLMREEGLLKK
jgi:glycosyltransferase involved in cell wall biosynthesis